MDLAQLSLANMAVSDAMVTHRNLRFPRSCMKWMKYRNSQRNPRCHHTMAIKESESDQIKNLKAT